MEPLVSVIIPTYNYGHLLSKAIDSVIAQTYKNIELIIIDDGSTDNTKSVVESYDNKFTYINQNNTGVSSARNHGIIISNGQYVAFLDADDIWYQDKISVQVQYMLDHRECRSVSCQNLIINELTNEKKVSQYYNFSAYDCRYNFLSLSTRKTTFSGGSGVIIDKNIFNDVGLFNTKLTHGEDWEFWIRISYKYPIYMINKILYEIHYHKQTGQLRSMKKREKDLLWIYYNIISQPEHKLSIFQKRNILSNIYLSLAYDSETIKINKLTFKYLLKALYLQPSNLMLYKIFMIRLIRTINVDLLYKY